VGTGNRERDRSVQVQVRWAAVCFVTAALASCGSDSEEAPRAASEGESVLTSAMSVPSTALAPSTTATSVSSTGGPKPLPTPPITTTPPPSLDEMASARPERVRPGDRITINPAHAVQRNCADTVGVYDFDGLLVGQVTGGDKWHSVSSGVPATWPACLGTTTAAGMDLIVPLLPDGGYRFCLSVNIDFVGCATVFVSKAQSSEIATTSPAATADGSVRDVAAIVVAVATHRLYGATGMSGAPTVDRVNVIDRYGTPSVGGNLEVGPDSGVILEHVRAAVDRALAPAAVAWVGHWAQVIDDLSPSVEVLLTFGEPVFGEHQATIVVDMVCGTLCGEGMTYTLDWSDVQGWTVTDTNRGWVA
jgi:hypothetical protein